mgnify:CR=1 FL=1
MEEEAMILEIGVLAGGEGRRLGAPVPKAWVKLCGKPICHYVIEEAQKLSADRILVVCHDEWKDRLPNESRITALPRQGGYLRDLFQLIDSCKSDYLLVVNADAVLINAKTMSNLVKLAEVSTAGFIWPAVPAEKCLPQFDGRRYVPGSKKLLARCNAMILRPGEIKIDQATRVRMQKYPGWGELIALGISGCFRIATGQFTVDELCNLMGKILGCKVEIPVIDDPALAFDIDSRQDWSFANYELRGGGVPIIVE